MDVFEITGYATGVSKAGVNYLQPSDAFQDIQNGFIYRQVLQSRQGVARFCPRLAGETRIYGIFEHTLPDSTKELLAFDKNYLYKYNVATNVFDQIAFAGSMAGYAGFNISANDFYISGVSYPTATNTARFVFTGEGITPNGAGSSIFFYNGTDVRDFTSVVDNPNFAQYTGGTLTKATYVTWFNERLNFFVPVISGTIYEQGILYSGIRTTSGNGDKFNVAGSGLLQADTYETITGMTILGQIIVLNFNRSAYTLEKTTDAFNPYFIRKIPGVLGTNAKFSAVSWNDVVDSLGRTAVLECDGRRSLRKDNKIPEFTANEIDQLNFNLTYGGFDRLNEQFLWSYLEAGTDSLTQNKVLVRNYEEDSWSVYDQRFSVLGQTDLGQNLTWDDIYEGSGNPSWRRWNTTEEIWDRIGIGLTVQKTLAGDDFGFIYELNQDYDDYITDISDITQAAQAVLTIDASAFLPGDLVTISNVADMTEINNYDEESTVADYTPYTVVAATATSLTLNVDSQNFTAYIPAVSGGTVSKVITFSAKTIPFNPYREIGRRCFISHVEFLLDTDGGSLLVDVYEDEQEDGSPFKANVLILPTDTLQQREWITMIVDNEANFHTFVLKQQSPSAQVRLTSMRIHCRPGGYTAG